jgi:hypothetical protein
MTKFDPSPGGVCQREVDIPAYLQDELMPDQRLAFEEHMAICSSCAEETEQYRKLIGHLLQSQPAIPKRDLTCVILSRVQAGVRFNFRKRIWAMGSSPVFLRAAALLLCLVAAGVLFCVLRTRADLKYEGRVVAAAIEWLGSTQELDGHWDAAKWGAQKNYTPGITALAILAFLKEDANALEGRRAEVIRRGLDYLLSLQNADGRIGPLNSGTPYNQGIATLALLEACSRQKNGRWEQSADRSLKYVQATQLASGGWGYPRTPGDSGNTSVTVWQLQALFKAEAMGRKDVRPSIEKGMRWLDNMVGPDGTIGYSRPQDFPYGNETLTAAGALCFLTDKSSSSPRLVHVMQALRSAAQQKTDVDYYRLYFITHALQAAGGKDPELIAGLREALVACQTQSGVHAGSFEANDRWGSAGGRVYATAMAVLAL